MNNLITSQRLSKIFALLFVALFFAYLFGPLVVMGLSAFNSSAFPRISPWDCFTVEWYSALAADDDLVAGLKNSVIIAIGVVILAVPLGLAGAMLLTQASARLRPWYYSVVISPILIPGVVLGISTLVFWDRMGRMFGADYDSFFYDGIFLTIVGQSTFVAAYAMLVFISRLQRFDSAQEEAALDLGATHIQTFRKILLPFLAPAIASASVLGFLASFENYNTTIFTIVSQSTLTTVLASKVRYGINPSISALAVVIIGLTLLGAIYFEILKRREQKYRGDVARLIKAGATTRAAKAGLLTSPALWLATAVCMAGLGVVYFAGTMGVNECKAAIEQQKTIETARKIQAFQTRRMFKLSAPSAVGEAAGESAARPTASEAAAAADNPSSLFAPANLGQPAVESTAESALAPDEPESPPAEADRQPNLFAPSNLGQPAVESAPDTPPADTN